MNEHHLKEDFFKILRLLSSKEDLSQRDLSGHLDMSLGKTNYLLKAMIKRGLIMVRNFYVRDNKIKKVKYVLTKEGFDVKLQWAYEYLKRKEQEYLDLKRELEKDTGNMNFGGDMENADMDSQDTLEEMI
ncbi:MAG: MarR family EPS-associated transcriptional regulator [Candidatus Omnitrophica bacterium]|nr:MarR family EPS-associated transcriptional regulator [Candidatus Omnitrophota bacterium]